ncbi:hypothetical protein SEA_SAFTANT_72 [Streptomyces phage Saftant]|uniref:Uncharacterized protein n=1 Tax=Streptomyces phage Saftant TaxID=2601693 RepID=A0A5J6D8D9_9CAUD|nr:hypothetical protein KGG95_gp72 [Streptomyces phage Saftant]QEQ94104.1 hypothetical protein SEA_SAFTANT_72 [Streptomyces phage Saftant]
MKLSHKILAATTLVAVGWGLGNGKVEVNAAPDKPVVSVENVSSAKPEPIAIKVPVPDLPTKPCSDDGGRNCYWDVKNQPAYWVDRNDRVTYLQPKLNDSTKRRLWEAGQKKKGAESWGTVDGHRFCWARIGDTSYVTCWDGYKTTS